MGYPRQSIPQSKSGWTPGDQPVIRPPQSLKYLFDTRGWLVIPGVITEDEIVEMRSRNGMDILLRSDLTSAVDQWSHCFRRLTVPCGSMAKTRQRQGQDRNGRGLGNECAEPRIAYRLPQ